MSHTVEIFFEVGVVVEELLLVLQVFLNDDFAVEDMFQCGLPSSESSLLFCQQFLGLTFPSVEDD
ncbi:hypothetical protein DPMN_057468 [Dreissena polymorpha]|uniref:Uncharacterized protein n=1 Tax=Dreissena polymorpha TaxID=45954 RepID=A0A9D4HE71_DREPO|nr:hypothetical protein DPMN_057468 [Dreissena polymorpha]